MIQLRTTLTDTITVRDTIWTNIYDTIRITVRDTIRITDTLHVTINDTLWVTHTDTIHRTITDTVYYVIRDTIPIGVTDTLYIDIVKTGLNKPNNILNTIKIYPNPATDEIVIDNGNYIQIPNYSVMIVNSIGQTVYTNTINRQIFRLNTSTWGDAGTYFLQILDNHNNVIETRKIVLK
jgi:hypothetical protein